MKKPNFFIVGAPKCGTTSLAAWLQEHPRIFMPELKEPCYFDPYVIEHAKFSLSDYEHLFDAAVEEHLAVGEASTGYLRSETALGNILNYAPDAKFIVCIRNPVDMALSWHRQMLRDGSEALSDFRAAWNAEYARRKGVGIPRLCDDASKLFYRNVCSLGRQLECLFRLAGRGRIHVIFLADLRERPDKVYRDVLEFLGVSDDGRGEFPVLNPGRRLPRWLSVTIALVRNWKLKLGIYGSLGLLDGGVLDRIFSKNETVAVSPKVEAELIGFFESDIRCMEKVLGKDLSAWYRR